MRPLLSPHYEANIELQDCVGLIGLVAPRDTYHSASLLGDLTLKSWEGGVPQASADRELAASVAFMALARRDIGVDTPSVEEEGVCPDC
jgi:hypothetical protein